MGKIVFLVLAILLISSALFIGPGNCANGEKSTEMRKSAEGYMTPEGEDQAPGGGRTAIEYTTESSEDWTVEASGGGRRQPQDHDEADGGAGSVWEAHTTELFSVDIGGTSKGRFQEFTGTEGQMELMESEEGGVNKQTPRVSGPFKKKIKRPASLTSEDPEQLIEDITIRTEKEGLEDKENDD